VPQTSRSYRFWYRRLKLAPLGIVLLLAACAAPSAQTRSAPAGGTEANEAAGRVGAPVGRAPAAPSRLVIGVGADTAHLSTKLDPQTGSFRYDLRFLVNSPLAVLDGQDHAAPLLASELPSRDRRTWLVNADGSMATTWKLRPNALWQDGRPLTAPDFTFAFRVYQDPEVEVYQRTVEQLIERLEVLDEHTFVVHWKQIYLRADRLLTGELEPLPEHLVGALYASGDKAAFQQTSFWSSTDYIGNGPFRIVEWEKGSHSVYRAFDRFFLGRPKLDEIVFRVITDVNTAVTHVLGGSIDYASAQTVNAEGGIAIKQEWGGTGGGQVLFVPAVFHVARIQHHPERVGTPALLDVRVRRAMVHAIDRASLAETVSAGASPPADTFVTPNNPLFPRVQEAIAKYPYDPTRAAALLQEAGWTKRGDTLLSARGDPLSLEIKASAVTLNIPTVSIAAAHLRTLGMQVSERIYRQGSEDREQSVNYPGLHVRTVPSMEVPVGLRVYATEQCPTAERRFVGDNDDCFSNPEFDRLYRIATTTLDERGRTDTFIQALRVMTEDVAVIGFSYNIEFIPVRKGLVGPVPRSATQRGYTWNIHEWHWTQ
jgi:peptide/nickel transport system substrate-binding protein